MNEKDIEELLKPSTLFVELDAILDTRAGLLFNMSTKAFDMNILRGLHKRSADVFEGVSETLYNKQYEGRDSKVLSNAQVTGIGKRIADFAKEVANRNLKTPVKNSCEIVLNLYPYTLKEEEIGEIVLAISKLTLDLANITAVYMKPEEVSFDYIKEHIDILYIYDYASWINANIDPLMELKGRMSPEVPMICPAVAKTKKISGYQHKDVFARMARAYAPMIGLDFIDVANFTMVLAPTLEQAAKTALRQPQPA